MPQIQKRIHIDDDMHYFQHKCPGYSLILRFLERACLCVKGNTHSERESPKIQNVITLLNNIAAELELFPSLPQPMRFGNKAFRSFHEWLVQNASNLISSHLGIGDPIAVQELSTYLTDSFGNPIRIDCGTGHELAFFAFLIVLVESGWDPTFLGTPSLLKVLLTYFSTVRKIINRYHMEPAGSHGVWGLDDYNHLPFLLGSAQLIGHEADICSPKDMYMQCTELSAGNSQLIFPDFINYIKQSKCKYAPFQEVAPMLNDILNKRSDNWTQVCYTLMQLYKSEVLAKRPIMQHFYFGNYVSWE